MDYVISKEAAEIIMAILRSFINGFAAYGVVAIAFDLGNWLADRDIEREAKRRKQYDNR